VSHFSGEEALMVRSDIDVAEISGAPAVLAPRSAGVRAGAEPVPYSGVSDDAQDRGRGHAPGPVRGPAASPPPVPLSLTGPGDPGFWGDLRIDGAVPGLKRAPRRGWRGWLYRTSGRRLNPGQSRRERVQTELEMGAARLLRGNYRIGVVGKGGVGKTTVAAGVGSIFAAVRTEDVVVAVDADTGFGKLGARVDPRAVYSFWELVGDQRLRNFADIRALLGVNGAGLFVLPGDVAAGRGRVLDPAVYREAIARLDRFFAISLIDCGATMDAPVTEAVIADLDALIVVSSPRPDGGWAAEQTVKWLADRGLSGLLARTVVVLNDSHGGIVAAERAELVEKFSGMGLPVFEVPFDKELRPGGVIEVGRHVSSATRRVFLEIAATVARDFGDNTARRR
jgi:MinD-like ATPase involved in chromosome partitioning or flagellar assembly